MSDDLARFRELHGIGPTTEAELHQAGIRTWDDIASVTTALMRARGVATTAVRAIRDQARDRASKAALASDAGAPDRAGDADERMSAGGDGDHASRTPPTAAVRTHELSAVRQHLTVDAGKRLGGRVQEVDIALDAGDDGDGQTMIGYDARLLGRPYGTPDGPWRPVGRQAARGRPPRRLRFHGVALAPGLHRLRLDVTVTTTPGATTPQLAIAEGG